MVSLFEPLRLRDVVVPNRIVISPMLQYSAVDGHANDWHFLHYGRLAIGGAGIVIVEATAINPVGRTNHGDLGIWSDDHLPGLKKIAALIKSHGAVPAIQLYHAGRKASTQRPWNGYGALTEQDRAQGDVPWRTLGPSPIPYGDRPSPGEMTTEDIARVKSDWAAATERARAAGFEIVEIHGAHGYLLHTFLSPASNKRADAYGNDAAGRMRLPLEIVESTRKLWPQNWPIFYRLSAEDEGGCTLADTVAFCRELIARGVDVIDCSGGALLGPSVGNTRVKRGPGYQVHYAETVKQQLHATTMAVGLITDPHQADSIINDGRADLVAIGREALFNPSWPLHAQRTLGRHDSFRSWPMQHGWWLDRREQTMAAGLADDHKKD